MQGRSKAFAAGRNVPYTTLLWHQAHLREAGAPLPRVDWKGVERKGGQGGKGSGGAARVARAGARERGGKGWGP